MRAKKGLRALSLLLIVALLGAIFVPAVSAGENLNLSERKSIIENNHISIKTALGYANLYMSEYTSLGLDENSWIGTSINEEPILIYDLNGELLFYQFSIEKNTKTVGSITTPASKVLGFPVQSIGEPYTYDIENCLNNLYGILLSNNYKDFKLVSSQIVCYDYPKLGVLVKLLNQETETEKTLIFDALEMSSKSNKVNDVQDDSWSYYKQISDDQLIKNIEYWNIDSKATGESDWISPFYTVSQDHDDWCMVATAWLITKHYYPSTTRDQDYIADYMDTSENGAPTWFNFINYFIDSYSQGGLGKYDSYYYNYIDEDLNYNDIKEEISHNRPIAVDASGHERACIGYWQYTSGNKLYKFSDPDPQRTIYWEAADSQGYIMNYNNFAIIK